MGHGGFCVFLCPYINEQFPPTQCYQLATESQQLILFIDKWWGATYKLGGCSLSGVDCSCFSGILYEEIYKKKISRTVKSIYQESVPVEKKNLREGDFVFFKIESKEPNHVGVFMGNNKFVHASTKKGVTISDLDEDYYRKYYFSGGRPKK